jgi:hypothetical protein
MIRAPACPMPEPLAVATATLSCKIIPNAFRDKAVLKIMFVAMNRAVGRWRAIKATDFERRRMTDFTGISRMNLPVRWNGSMNGSPG